MQGDYIRKIERGEVRFPLIGEFSLKAKKLMYEACQKVTKEILMQGPPPDSTQREAVRERKWAYVWDEIGYGEPELLAAHKEKYDY